VCQREDAPVEVLDADEDTADKLVTVDLGRLADDSDKQGQGAEKRGPTDPGGVVDVCVLHVKAVWAYLDA
jgi:hypothetical protein